MIEIKEFVQADALRPVKNRVALIETTMTEEEQNGIRIPQRRTQLFAFGQAVALGAEAEKCGVALGDNCLFQASPMFEKTIRYKIGERHVLLMHAGDLIGKVDRSLVSLEEFIPLGRWVIVERQDATMVGGIHIPSQNNMADIRRHFVAKIGPQVNPELNLKVGQEVFCDPNRVNPLRFMGTKGEFGFVDCGFIYGTMEVTALSGTVEGDMPDPALLTHASDCAQHNPPAMPAGPCDCDAKAAS